MDDIILYGAPFSLYTGRARSYLMKSGRRYRETTPITRHYVEQVLPAAGGRQSLPTLELPDGSVIRDGVAIVDHFEHQAGYPFSPTTPVQQFVSRLFDVISAEGLLRPAMHYRWDFPDENLDFLRFHFLTAIPRGPDREKKAAAAADRMRGAGRAFGAVPETFPVIESLYLELLTRLDAHFSEHPYLLGNRPCIGDFGLIAPLYAHLGRDPKPLSIMQAHGIRVFRWVERMNRPEADIGEFENQDETYLPGDEIPQTLIDVLRQLAIDFVPETRAAMECINDWLAQQDELPAGTPVERGVGFAGFEMEGVSVSALAQPFRFYLLKRVQDDFDSMNDPDQAAVTALLKACDLSGILDYRLNREIGRDRNLEVWL